MRRRYRRGARGQVNDAVQRGHRRSRPNDYGTINRRGEHPMTGPIGRPNERRVCARLSRGVRDSRRNGLLRQRPMINLRNSGRRKRGIICGNLRGVTSGTNVRNLLVKLFRLFSP